MSADLSTGTCMRPFACDGTCAGALRPFRWLWDIPLELNCRSESCCPCFWTPRRLLKGQADTRCHLQGCLRLCLCVGVWPRPWAQWISACVVWHRRAAVVFAGSQTCKLAYRCARSAGVLANCTGTGNIPDLAGFSAEYVSLSPRVIVSAFSVLSAVQGITSAACSQAAGPSVIQKLGRVLREKASGDLGRVFKGASKTRERLGVGPQPVLPLFSAKIVLRESVQLHWGTTSGTPKMPDPEQ